MSICFGDCVNSLGCLFGCNFVEGDQNTRVHTTTIVDEDSIDGLDSDGANLV